MSVLCDTEFALIVQELAYGPEIRHVHPYLGHHEILGLDFPVNAASGVHFFDRVKLLHSDVRDDVLEDFTGFLSLLDVDI